MVESSHRSNDTGVDMAFMYQGAAQEDPEVIRCIWMEEIG